MKPWHLVVAAILVVLAAILLVTDYSEERRQEWVARCVERSPRDWCERHWETMTPLPNLQR